MADGDIVLNQRATGLGKNSIGYKLLDAAGIGTDSGVWVDVHNACPSMIDIQGSFTGTVKIMVSNADTKPANNVDGNEVGSDVTAAGLVSLLYPARWIKAKAILTAGSVSAYYHGVV